MSGADVQRRAPRSTASRALLLLAWVVPAGVLLQAVLAGPATFLAEELFGPHGGVGHGVLPVSLAVAVLAWVVRVSPVAAWLASINVVLLVAQTGLGYAGHRGGSAVASAVHVPLGVTVLGIAVAVAVLLTVRLRDGR